MTAFAIQRMEHVGIVVDGLHASGTSLVGQVEDYHNDYRLCFVRDPGDIILELIEELR